MTSKPKRISDRTITAVQDLADREHRTFIAQLDLVVTAGLTALGEPTQTAEQANANRESRAQATR